ncbi:y01B [Symbiodinium microadriaticum]|nr:y01B [Symbiodinium microadriaticum]
MPQFRRCAATCSTALLKRHFPDQLAQENAAPPQKYLGRLADLVQEARHAKSHAGMRGKRSKATGRTGNEYGEMPCTACGKYFPQAMFAKGGCWCKGCSAAKFRKYHRTLCGSASVLVNSARRKSRAKGWHCGIDQADIFEMLLEQGGRCHYSSVPMEILFPNSNWRMSLERFNNSDGYFRQNCALVAAEFNSSDFSRAPGVKKEDVEGSAQWSAEKFHFVCNAFNSIVDLDMLQKHVTHALGKPFLSGPSAAAYGYKYFRTLRGKSKSLVGNARFRSKNRHQDFDIDYTDILRILLQQRGRCFYSGVPLQYTSPHIDWVVSLERLDNNLGYVKGNCVLIAAEFNTADHSRRAKEEVSGSSQWSLAKGAVKHIMDGTWLEDGWPRPKPTSANPVPEAQLDFHTPPDSPRDESAKAYHLETGNKALNAQLRLRIVRLKGQVESRWNTDEQIAQLEDALEQEKSRSEALAAERANKWALEHHVHGVGGASVHCHLDDYQVPADDNTVNSLRRLQQLVPQMRKISTVTRVAEEYLNPSQIGEPRQPLTGDNLLQHQLAKSQQGLQMFGGRPARAAAWMNFAIEIADMVKSKASKMPAVQLQPSWSSSRSANGFSATLQQAVTDKGSPIMLCEVPEAKYKIKEHVAVFFELGAEAMALLERTEGADFLINSGGSPENVFTYTSLFPTKEGGASMVAYMEELRGIYKRTMAKDIVDASGMVSLRASGGQHVQLRWRNLVLRLPGCPHAQHVWRPFAIF